jgi:hypothetical protein
MEADRVHGASCRPGVLVYIKTRATVLRSTELQDGRTIMTPDGMEVEEYEDRLTERALISRLETAREWEWLLDKFQYPANREKESEAKRVHWKRAQAYFILLGNIAALVLRIKICDRREIYPPNETPEEKEKRLSLADEYETDACREYYYDRRYSKEAARNELCRLRAEARANVESYCDAVRPWIPDEKGGFWPATVFANSPIKLTSVNNQSESSVPVPFKKKSDGSRYQQFLEAQYGVARSKNPNVGWEDVAKLIVVGTTKSDDPDHSNYIDDTNLLPEDSRDRITDTKFSGSLFEFIVSEDQKRRERISSGHSARELIDFKERFYKVFSNAKNAYEARRVNQRQRKD